jgi:lysylphosphatidylglycerol synthetase-like protein (DUF2156 family)
MSTSRDDQTVDYTPEQLDYFKRDLKWHHAWWQIIRDPKNYFLRVRVANRINGNDTEIVLGKNPDSFAFFSFLYFLLCAAWLGWGVISYGLGYIFFIPVIAIQFGSFLVSFFALSGIYHLLTRHLNYRRDFEVAKCLVGYSQAPTLALAIPTAVGYVVWAVGIAYSLYLQYYALKILYDLPHRRAIHVLIAAAVTIFILGFLLRLFR